MFTNCERLPLQTSCVSDLVVSTTSGIRDFAGADQRLNSSEWPNYCDHSVTSADVRLASA